ncbi:MAG: hypothetical protein JSS20_10475 [Proteobacteria bacterium]|nr:hypothetical protein [Pseudomonadota bacterium]
MIRVFIENMALFLLPTIVYAIYVATTRSGSRQGILDEAPLVWLVAAGTALVIMVLAIYGTGKGGKPGEAYVPPVVKDGHIEPGHAK